MSSIFFFFEYVGGSWHKTLYIEDNLVLTWNIFKQTS